MKYQWVSLTEYYNPNEVIELLAQCMWPDEERILAELECYRKEEERSLFGFVIDHALIGLVGVSSIGEMLRVRHIAVKPMYRHQGLGSQMILELRSRYAQALIAETDRESVEFYRKAGFQIESLGEKYPGVERYKCTLNVEI